MPEHIHDSYFYGLYFEKRKLAGYKVCTAKRYNTETFIFIHLVQRLMIPSWHLPTQS